MSWSNLWVAFAAISFILATVAAIGEEKPAALCFAYFMLGMANLGFAALK